MFISEQIMLQFIQKMYVSNEIIEVVIVVYQVICWYITTIQIG